MEEAHKGTFADMALYKIERAKDELDTAKIVLEAQKMQQSAEVYLLRTGKINKI